MKRVWSVIGLGCTAIVMLVLGACSHSPVDPIMPVTASSRIAMSSGSTNGAAGVESAYYDSAVFTINLMELSEDAADKILEHNPSFNIIYEMDDIDAGQFFDVIDAIPGDGMNPLWLEVAVEFNPGFTPHQFYSDDEVLEAAAGDSPEITLRPTDELYRCSVIGKP